MSHIRIALIAFLVVIGIVGYSAVYTVHERDQVLVPWAEHLDRHLPADVGIFREQHLAKSAGA